MDMTGIDLFDQNAGKVVKQVRLRNYMNISGIDLFDLFDQNAGMKCANVRLLDSDVHGYHWY